MSRFIIVYAFMTEKELKKLSRKQLLELLLKQTEHSEQLQLQVDQLQEQLRSRRLAIRNAGSLAEASLRLNDVFEAAQAAADQYLENVRKNSETEVRRAKEAMLAETEQYCAARKAEADRKLKEINVLLSYAGQQRSKRRNPMYEDSHENKKGK